MILIAKDEIPFILDDIYLTISYIHKNQEIEVFSTMYGLKFEFMGKLYSFEDFKDKFEIKK